MKERRTFLLPAESGLKASDVQVNKQNEVVVSKAHLAAKERRITVALSELPREARAVLEKFHELHVRFQSGRNNASVFSPINSRTSPGLHVFFTPKDHNTDTHLCEYLRELGALDSGTRCGSFSRSPVLSERFASSSTYQFYTSVRDEAKLRLNLKQMLCGLNFVSACPGNDSTTTSDTIAADFLLLEEPPVTYMDFDFDVISHTVTVTSYYAPNKRDAVDRIAETVGVPAGDLQLELGVMQGEHASEQEELALGGFYMNVDGDDHPHGTMFSFPARHHEQLNNTGYKSHFKQPTGLHPQLEISVDARELQPPRDSCALHAYWTLPSSVFIDRYQLSDTLFLASQRIIALRSLSGEEDLEAPDWTIDAWGSAALFELAHPKPGASDGEWTMSIPTHLRYAQPNQSSIAVPWPVMFWACQADEGLKFATNPFDRVNLGYDGLFGPKTMFYHIPPALHSGTYELIQIPTLDLGSQSTAWVPTGTTVAVAVGFLWVCWKLLSATHDRSTGQYEVTNDKKSR